MKKSTKRLFAAVLAAASLLALTACGGKTEEPKTDDSAQTEQPAESSGSKELSVYTAFPESEVIYYFNKFEEETGIKVVYEEFETNEIMYPKVSAGAVAYDVVCPSDYMVQRMIQEGLLEELNYDNIPNISNLDETYLAQAEGFDPGNKYCVPYCWGTVGILYNKTMVDEPIDSWDVLWDEKYKDNILMQDLSLLHI